MWTWLWLDQGCQVSKAPLFGEQVLMQGSVDVRETLSEKKRFPIAVHQRGRMLPTVPFFLSSPASVISFPWLLHYSCSFPVVLSAGVFLCSMLTLCRQKLKAASTCTYAAMLQWGILLFFFSLNSACCYVDLGYKLRVFLMVVASMPLLMLNLYSVHSYCFPHLLSIACLHVERAHATIQETRSFWCYVVTG